MKRIITYLIFLIVAVSAVAQVNFAQAQDRSIGDVLKHMPGIDVANAGSGTVSY